MTDASVEAIAPEGPGRLTVGGRSAATNAAIPLLATYFADAPAWDLVERRQVGTAGLDDLTRYVRMRVAIAAAVRLDEILRSIGRAPTFQYTQTQDESIGAVRGRLDIPRFVRNRLRTESPRRYPIRVVRRAYTTPEVVLAAHAAFAVANDLRNAPIGHLPMDSPERAAIGLRQSRLRQFLRQSNIAEAAASANKIRRRGEREALVNRVRRRVGGGHIAKPEPYAALLRWVDEYGSAVGVAAGTIEWAFYDERFDTKLFEIWSLKVLTEALTSRLGPPITGPRPLFERDQGAIVAWRAGGANVRLYFQASLERSGLGKPRWNFTAPDERPLGGIPDIALSIELVDGRTLVALVDPKLRVRDGAPSEELYKLLGYFGNAGTRQAPLGAIVFYAPGQTRIYRLEDGESGRLEAIGVDPELPAASRGQVEAVVDLLLSSVGLEPSLIAAMADLREGSPEGPEATAAARQSTAVDAMRRQAALLPGGSIEPFKRTVAAMLQGAWVDLDDEAARMVGTAEYFGMTAPDDADHSGPLLGLAATCERVIHARLIDGARARNPRAFAEVRTLGSVIAAIRDALSRRPGSDAGRAISREIDALRLDRRELSDLVDGLQSMNSRYRIPAAHRDLVDQRLWQAGRLAILRPDTGLLPLLLHALVRH